VVVGSDLRRHVLCHIQRNTLFGTTTTTDEKRTTTTTQQKLNNNGSQYHKLILNLEY